MRVKQLLITATAALLMAGPVLAQPDETAMRAARQLGNEGIDLYEKGDYATAMDRLGRAYGVIKVPTLGLWYARSLAKNGKLVEASERYLEVSRAPVEAGEPPLFATSRQEAATEHQALQARIPTLQITLDGVTPQEVTIVVDGKPLDANLVGVPISLNPGARNVEAKRGEETVTETVTLKEGEKQSVVLRFGAEGAAAAAAPADPAPVAPGQPAPGAAPAAATTADSGVDEGGSSQALFGWVALGVGGAGLAVGAITHFMAKGKEGDLDGVCEDGLCPTASQSDIDSYDTLTTVAPIGMIVGGVGITAGIVLLLTAPSDEPEQAGVTPWLGLGSAGVRGTF